MATITLNVPEELAVRLTPLREWLPQMLAQMVESWPTEKRAKRTRSTNTQPIYLEVVDFLATAPTPERIIAFKISRKAQARLEMLLEKNRAEGLTEDEQAEMETFLKLNHVMMLLKARSRPAAHSSGS